jgi:hypothetical protein
MKTFTQWLNEIESEVGNINLAKCMPSDIDKAVLEWARECYEPETRKADSGCWGCRRSFCHARNPDPDHRDHRPNEETGRYDCFVPDSEVANFARELVGTGSRPDRLAEMAGIERKAGESDSELWGRILASRESLL